MSPDELQSLAGQHVPGQGPVEILRLRGGLVNETYRVLRDGVTHALRVAAVRPRDLGLDREWEARVLQHAARADLAPAVEYCDSKRGVLISRWIEGSAWSAQSVRRQPAIAAVADLMHRIHALPLPSPTRAMSPGHWIDYYGAALVRTDPQWQPRSVCLAHAANVQLARLAALPDVNPVLCHSDLHILNLLDRSPLPGAFQPLLLLDWEYAHASDPLWDLAGWSANNDLEEGQRQELLAAYVGRMPTRNERLRLGLLCWLYDYVCLLWSQIYLKQPGEPVAEGFTGRMQLLEARLQARPK